jgi:hypothetical protein
VIDGQGTIQWSYLSHRGEPGADGILEALESLPTPARTA